MRSDTGFPQPVYQRPIQGKTWVGKHVSCGYSIRVISYFAVPPPPPRLSVMVKVMMMMIAMMVAMSQMSKTDQNAKMIDYYKNIL